MRIFTIEKNVTVVYMEIFLIISNRGVKIFIEIFLKMVLGTKSLDILRLQKSKLFLKNLKSKMKSFPQLMNNQKNFLFMWILKYHLDCLFTQNSNCRFSWKFVNSHFHKTYQNLRGYFRWVIIEFGLCGCANIFMC